MVWHICCPKRSPAQHLGACPGLGKSLVVTQVCRLGKICFMLASLVAYCRGHSHQSEESEFGIGRDAGGTHDAVVVCPKAPRTPSELDCLSGNLPNINRGTRSLSGETSQSGRNDSLSSPVRHDSSTLKTLAIDSSPVGTGFSKPGLTAPQAFDIRCLSLHKEGGGCAIVCCQSFW